MGTADDLRRWVEAGLIDEDTAARISEHESRKGGERVGRGTEAVAYLGAVLVLVALAILAAEFWDRIEPWGRFTLGAIVTGVLIGAGWLLGRSAEPAVNRAQAFAWFLAVGAVALTAGVFFDGIVETDGQESFLWTSLVTLVVTIALWLARSSTLAIVAMAFATWAATIAIISRLDTVPDWAFGLAFAGLGIAWLLLTWGGILRPATASYAISAIGILFVAFPEGSHMPWPILGLVGALALMGLSVRLNQTVLLGFGVAGLFVYIPMMIFELFEESLGVPVALLITGLALLGVVVGTVRFRKEVET
ncbi:MAG: DUF2157 domain-containing protein [Armatimonadetes bacterium]|nr:MAG: DUF2157 domain-containing protein [Armatimonadota bacterium]